MPGRLDVERVEVELLPQRARVLHVLARRQGERRHRIFARGVDQHAGVRGLGSVLRPLYAAAVGHQMHVLDRVGAIGERPQHRVHAGRIDVLADRDDDLSAIGLQGRGAVQGAPDLAARRFFRELHEDDGAKIGQPLVHHHATHALDPEAIAQVAQKQRLVGHLFDEAGFARRHLADDGGEYRRALVGDRGHPHRHVVGFERDVAVALAERGFGLELFGVDQPLDHDFGRRRHVEVDRRGFRRLDRRAGERAGDAELVHVDGELLRASEHDYRRAADHDRDRHGFAPLAIFEPMQIAAGAARLARNHAHHQPIGGLERGTVGAHVLDAAVGIPRHA